MEQSAKQSNLTLIFVYNADSGLFNTLTDIAHKTFSPQTYQCQLCALTHSTFGMRKGWKQFLETLDVPLEFLHADELRQRYGVSGALLPAIFEKDGESVEIWLAAESINQCRTLDDLKQLIRGKLR